MAGQSLSKRKRAPARDMRWRDRNACTDTTTTADTSTDSRADPSTNTVCVPAGRGDGLCASNSHSECP